MFFPRLRRKAKPVFVLLALVFGVGFVALGVGTGVQGTSLGDVIQGVFGSDGSSGPSVKDAQEKLAKNPKDAAAQLELANAYQANGNTAQAVAAMQRYTELRPRDVDGLQQLASLLTRQATEARQRAALVQGESQDELFGQTFGPGGELGQALSQDPVTQALTQQASQRSSVAIAEMQRRYREVAQVYQRLTLLEPQEPSVFLQLGQSSELAGDYASAIAAYKQFLELAPDDANAPLVRAEIKTLEGQATAGTG